MIPNKNIAARVTFPVIILLGYADSLFNSHTKTHALWTTVVWLPPLFIGLWLLFVPSYLKFNDEKAQVTIITTLKKVVVPYNQVERLEKRAASFARIYTSSGETFLFILENCDRYQMPVFDRPK